jgi:8-oxo-dGTP diphosphatase
MGKERVIIVNEKDEIIGHKERGTLEKEDIYRVSALWVINSKGEILLAKRHRNKTHHPGMWGPAVAGTVDEGESYGENIIKETEEEIGLKDIKFKLGPKVRRTGEYEHFTQWYLLTVDQKASEFKIQEDEVEVVKWFSKEELTDWMKTSPEKFLPSMPGYLELLK